MSLFEPLKNNNGKQNILWRSITDSYDDDDDHDDET